MPPFRAEVEVEVGGNGGVSWRMRIHIRFNFFIKMMHAALSRMQSSITE
jgi:hypothetical protein